MKIRHPSLDVKWWLAATEQELGKIFVQNGAKVPAEAARMYLLDQLADGILCIPVGEPCEGFSYQTGCPGHETEATE